MDFPHDAQTKTLDDLSWERVVAAVLARCRGPRANEAKLPLATSPDGARTALEETREAAGLLSDGEPLPLEGLRDVRPHIERVSRQGSLEGPALRDVRATCGSARVLRQFLGRRRDRTPRLSAACAFDPGLDALEDEIHSAIDVDGTVRDHASADLRRLRTETANLRSRLVARLEQLIVEHADLLSDRFYTIREGRYVIPVRSDAHDRVPGIVHATSQTGATVFVEPRALIPQGNRLKMAQAEMEREEARILAALSDLVRERLAALVGAADALDHADLRAACAEMGRDYGATVLPLLDEPRVVLHGGKHPVLLLDRDDVVPNDVALEAGQALVISGPNAGGKTVALEMIGLVALMMRAGLPVPADESSACGFFDPVMTDIGDEQSLSKNLSTFSAHVTNLAGILRGAGGTALVLLDELAGSTDPEEGAALACAVVDALCRRGAAVAVTTHYEALKALASGDERMRNASVGFDVAKLAPTFELRMDVPGASSALLVASRFGIPDDVIETARRALPEQSKTFDELVRKLEDSQRAASIERAGLESERRALDGDRARLARELESVRARERDKLGAEAERLLSLVRRARDDLREARKRLRQREIGEAELAAARKLADAAAAAAVDAKRAAEPGDGAPAAAEPIVDESELTVGARVWVPRLRAVAEVIEPPARGRVRVAAGAMKLAVGIDEIARTDERPAATKPVTPRTEPEPAGDRPAIRTPDNTLDVRGLRVDEALGMLESFVDRQYGRSEGVAFVVHGIGTGALRDAVRDHLSRDATYVARSRPGSPDEGGDRVTVVYLR